MNDRPPTTIGSTIIRKARPEPELIDITGYGQLPTYIENWNGWIIQEWGDWTWDDALTTSAPPR